MDPLMHENGSYKTWGTEGDKCFSYLLYFANLIILILQEIDNLNN